MPELTDDRLAAILASVGDHLVVAPAGAGDTGTATDHLTSTISPPNGSADDDGAPAPAGRRRRGGRRGGRGPQPRAASEGKRDAADGRSRRAGIRRQARRLLVAAAVVVVLTAIGVTVAPVREAVADWLGIGGTEVVRVGVGEGDPGDLPYLGDDLVPVDRPTAERRLGAGLPDTGGTELGPAPVLATPPEGGVILAWDDGATTLWVRPIPIERSPSETVRKLLTFDDRLERIDGLGEDAAIVEGPHVLGTPQRRLAAGTVLIWVDDRFEHRLESDLDPERLVEIAHAIERG